jgi:hypothetical protein
MLKTTYKRKGWGQISSGRVEPGGPGFNLQYQKQTNKQKTVNIFLRSFNRFDDKRKLVIQIFWLLKFPSQIHPEYYETNLNYYKINTLKMNIDKNEVFR